MASRENLELLVEDGKEHQSAHHDPALGLHCAGRCAEEVLDTAEDSGRATRASPSTSRQRALRLSQRFSTIRRRAIAEKWRGHLSEP
jgi:hypothetical protein